jgi:hypothetical protein
MKNTKLKMVIAIVAVTTTIISCKKEKQENLNSQASNIQTDINSLAKSGSGFNVLALRLGVENHAQISNNFDIATGSGVFTNVRLGSIAGPLIKDMTGISTINNNWTPGQMIFAITGPKSNYPGYVFQVNTGNMVATLIGKTTKPSGNVFLQDIERQVNSGLGGANDVYFAIEIGTCNIYKSATPVGGAPLSWTLATATSPSVSLPGITSLHGLDLKFNMLVVYSNQKLPTSPYSGIGVGAYFTAPSPLSTSFLTLNSTSPLDVPYLVTPNEDAALLLSDNATTFLFVTTPSASKEAFINCNSSDDAAAFTNCNLLWINSGTAPPSPQTFGHFALTNTPPKSHLLDYAYAW